MWAGVSGGIAEYFDIDPALVRLMWVAAAVVSGGLAIPVYILAWIILPRDDRAPAAGPPAWRDWSQEFHAETQRLAEEARRMAGEWQEPQAPQTPTQTTTTEDGWGARAASTPTAEPAVKHDPATDKGMPVSAAYVEPAPTAWAPPTEDLDAQRNHRGRHPKSAGVVLVGLGVLFLAANAGIFSWIEWRYMWPVILIGLGVVLLSRQVDWRGH
jgi:phage shock protein PspC (stress-responsive transcriptional regulator)